MKRYLFLVFIIVGVLLCTGCNGNITRDIRHTGFNVGGEFVCKTFFIKNEETGTMVNKIRYFTNTHLIDEDGKIYELSLSKKYMDGQNCYDIGVSVYVKAIFDNRIVKSVDNKYYYLSGQNNGASYSQVPSSDNSYAIYDLLLKGSDIVKVMTADGSKGLYYVLKTDGNVYGYTINSQDRNTPPKVISTQVIYSKDDYKGEITDFNYEGNSLNTFVRTSDKFYRMKMTNGKECTKYAGVECEFQMEEDTILEKHVNHIVVFNGSTLITDYGKMFTVSS